MSKATVAGRPKKGFDAAKDALASVTVDEAALFELDRTFYASIDNTNFSKDLQVILFVAYRIHEPIEPEMT